MPFGYVHYCADLQSVHGLRFYGNITRTRNVSEYMLVLALCLVLFYLIISTDSFVCSQATYSSHLKATDRLYRTSRLSLPTATQTSP